MSTQTSIMQRVKYSEVATVLSSTNKLADPYIGERQLFFTSKGIRWSMKDRGDKGAVFQCKMEKVGHAQVLTSALHIASLFPQNKIWVNIENYYLERNLGKSLSAADTLEDSLSELDFICSLASKLPVKLGEAVISRSSVLPRIILSLLTKFCNDTVHGLDIESLRLAVRDYRNSRISFAELIRRYPSSIVTHMDDYVLLLERDAGMPADVKLGMQFAEELLINFSDRFKYSQPNIYDDVVLLAIKYIPLLIEQKETFLESSRTSTPVATLKSNLSKNFKLI